MFIAPDTKQTMSNSNSMKRHNADDNGKSNKKTKTEEYNGVKIDKHLLPAENNKIYGEVDLSEDRLGVAQVAVALSPMEAEIMAICDAMKEIIWVRNLM
eukprot:Pgem_evm2s12907